MKSILVIQSWFVGYKSNKYKFQYVGSKKKTDLKLYFIFK